jgi:hypothetical protein
MPYGTLKDRQSASVLMSKEQQSCFNFGTFNFVLTPPCAGSMMMKNNLGEMHYVG